MKLSEVLNKYYVIPLNQSEIVGFGFIEDNLITITWTDSEDGEQHRQEFADQDIIIPDPSLKGAFVVIECDGDPRMFIALDGVDLEKVE